MGGKRKRGKQKESIAEKLLKIVEKKPKSAEELRRELKDRFGYNKKPEDIRINLLYLLRRERINRKKDGKIYKYHL